MNSAVTNKSRTIIPGILLEVSADPDRAVRYVSPEIEGLTGQTRESIVRRAPCFFSLISPGDRLRFETEADDPPGKENPRRLSDFRIRCDEEDHFRYVQARIYREESSLFIFMIDVTEYYREIGETRERASRFDYLLQTLKEAVWDWDMESDTVYYSDRWYEMIGYEKNEVSNTYEEWKESVHPEDLDRAMESLYKHLDGETEIYESIYRMKRKDGQWIWVRTRAVAQLDGRGNPVRLIGSYRDITGEKRTRERLEKMIITDEMTGLFNRRHYDAQINEEIRRAERYGSPLSVLMLDIDLFKQINDTFGHRAGDQALVKLAAAVKGKIRNTDSAYRTGGEEFMVIAPETNEICAVKAAERLREAVSAITIETGFGSFSFTVSIGVTTFIRGDSYSTLNERADIALYKSKDEGRNRTTLLRAE